jgi:hypothetical protein
MKTAILISGHARTFARCYRNQKWQVFRHFDDPYFFVSVVDDEDAEAMELLRKDYLADRVFIERVKQPDHIALPAGCPPEESWRLGQPFMHEPYAISVPPQAVLKQLWHLGRVWDFFTRDNAITDFDRFVRVRPDLWFHSYTPPVFDDVAFVPWWGRFGGCNDRFAILSPRAANAYFSAFDNAPHLIAQGCPLHPESLVRATLGMDFIRVRKLAVEFSTLRKNGEMRQPEYLMGDIAEGLS